MAFSNQNSENRSNGFQILADGTQDLAALVGLFATDGVERYTIDYTRGFLPLVTAPLSMLGLLGYVRALLKLSLGIDVCERTGFSTTSLRSYAGVRRRDVPWSERFTKVHYLERTIMDSSVEWRDVKTISHSHESMPLIAGGGKGKRALRDRRAYDPSISINMCSLKKSRFTAGSALLMCGISLMLTASLSSFVIVLLFTAPWTWTRFFACVGLPGSILVGGMPWCWIYITEHLPFEPSDWYRSHWKDSTTTGATGMRRASLMRKNSFAYFTNNDHFYIFDCRSVSRFAIRVIRVTSFCAAVCITVAYICQYIELRYASAKQSGIWLGIQGLLAMVRILAWDWAPKLFGYVESFVRGTDQRDRNFKDSLTELEIVLCWSSAQASASNAVWEKETHAEVESNNPDQVLFLPKWLISRIDNLKLPEAFSLWNRFRNGVVIEKDFYQIRDASEQWDMPENVFAKWLQLRCKRCLYGIHTSNGSWRVGMSNHCRHEW